MPGPKASRSRRWATAATAAAVLTLAGCGSEQQVAGAIGPDAAADDVVDVNSVELAPPADGLYEQGSDVVLHASLSNVGTAADQLVDVRGPGFADARLVADDGSAGAIAVPPNDNTYLQPDGSPSVVLEGIRSSLRSSQALEVTFVFEDAGPVTVEVPVAAPRPASPSSFPAPQDPTTDG